MFEKEAEEYAIGLTYPKFQDNQIANIVLRDVEGAFQQGAQFGYNKANEWHYVKDGDLPKDTTSLYLVRVYSWNFSFSHLYKKYTTYIPTVCEWNGEYFTPLDTMAYSNARNINSCVAWKEIVLPELKESEIKREIFPEITLPEESAEFVDKIIADAENRLKEIE